MILVKHLVQRGRHGLWSLRVALPRSLRESWGMKERIKALGTSDRKLAE